MGWEQRNGRSYYYRKERVGKKVVSRYVGRGEVADLIAQIEELESEGRIAERIALQADRERHQEVERVLMAIDQEAQLLLREAMTAAGYHDHKGQWRKKKT